MAKTKEFLGFGEIDFPDDMTDEEIAAAIASARGGSRALRIPEKDPHVALIQKHALEMGMDPHLALRMAAQESGFNPKAVSKAGAGGLFQLMPGTAKEVGVADVHDPAQNVPGGIGYFQKLLARYDGDVEKALAAYNWGPANLDKHGMEKMPAETRAYLKSILPFGNAPVGAPAPTDTPMVSVALPEGVKGVSNPRAGAPEAAVSAAPEAQYPGQGLVSGAGSALYNTARAIGGDMAAKTNPLSMTINQLMKSQSRTPEEVQKEYNVEANQLPGGTTGRILGSAIQAAPFARLAQAARVGPYVSEALGGGVEGAVTTPGDYTERAKAGLVNAGLSLPFTAAARSLSNPITMRPEVRELRDIHGVQAFPPLSMGAESQSIRDVASVTHGIPFLRNPQQRASTNFVNEAMERLADRATVPGQPNRLAEFHQSGGRGLRPGDVLTRMANDHEQAYSSTLARTRIPVTGQDMLAMQATLNNLPPEEAQRVFRIINNEIGYGTGFVQANQSVRITGQNWRAVRDNLQHYADNAPNTPAGIRQAEEVQGVIQHWNQMFDASVPRAVRNRVQTIDEAARYRREFEAAAGRPGAAQGVTPESMLESTIRRAGPQEASMGRAPGQDILTPLARMEPSSLGESASIGTHLRRSYPIAATAAALGSTLGIPHAAAGLAAMGLGTAASGYRPVARTLYGDLAAQRRMAQLMRDYPGFMGALVGQTPRSKKDEDAP